MSDENPPKPLSLFPGLPKSEPPPQPFQVELRLLGGELQQLTQLIGSTQTEDELIDAVEAASPRLDNLNAAAAFAVTERIAAIKDPLIAETFTAIVAQLEILRWSTMF